MPHPRSLRAFAAVLGACAFASVSAAHAVPAPQITSTVVESSRVPLAHIVRPEANAKNDRGRVSDDLLLADMRLLLQPPGSGAGGARQVEQGPARPEIAALPQMAERQDVRREIRRREKRHRRGHGLAFKPWFPRRFPSPATAW